MRFCYQCKKPRSLDPCPYCGCRTSADVPPEARPSDEPDTHRHYGRIGSGAATHRERLSYNDFLYEAIPHDGGPQRNNSKH